MKRIKTISILEIQNERYCSFVNLNYKSNFVLAKPNLRKYSTINCVKYNNCGVFVTYFLIAYFSVFAWSQTVNIFVAFLQYNT